MKLFVGLGNPGQKYAANRHNIGFMAVDRIAQDHGFSPWKSAFKGEICEGRLGSEKVFLLKPSTFMNLSGQSVQAAMAFYKFGLEDIIVFHDELDIAPGKCRVKQGGGHAGHNGLRSISAMIGESYGRIRLGVGHPGHKDQVANYVLHDFAKADQDWLENLLRGISEGAAQLAAGDGQKFMTAVALRVAPPRSSDKAEGRGKDRGTDRGEAAEAGEGRIKRAPKAETLAPAVPEPVAEDTRSALQKLAYRFR